MAESAILQLLDHISQFGAAIASLLRWLHRHSRQDASPSSAARLRASRLQSIYVKIQSEALARAGWAFSL